MNDFTKAWLVMACITTVVLLAQLAVKAENPDGNQFITDQNMIERYSQGGYLDDSDPYSLLPNGNSRQANDDFTDEYRETQNWIGGTGSNYYQDVESGSHNIFKMIGLPSEAVNVLAGLWFGLFGLVTLMMLLNREK